MDKSLAQLQRSPRDVARWQKAQQELLSGRSAAALTIYRNLAQRYPGIPVLWFELGNAASGDLDFDLANQAYRRALALAPANAPLLGMLGQQYQGLRQLDDARTCYERAVAADPNSVDARINLAVWFEKERRLDESWECVEACLARHPRDDQARYFRALLLHRKKKDAEAEAALRDLIRDHPNYPYVKYAAPHLLGLVLDQLGQYAEAIRWLCEAKTQVRTITNTALLEQAYDEDDRRRRELLEALSPEVLRRWCAEPPASQEPFQFAFLGGHPRSGTTLLEQVLGTHPEILAFDEPAAFSQEIINRLFPSGGRSVELPTLEALPLARRAELRGRYLKSLLREVPRQPVHPGISPGAPVSDPARSSDSADTPGRRPALQGHDHSVSGVVAGSAPGQFLARMLIDKNPSPTMLLPTWLRVFPELKIIIALRDPRDVVISCFFQNLQLNATNVNFLSLERTAKHYADLMDVWLRMRELDGFAWIESRYEDVVDNLAGEGRRVTEFLGLVWHPDQERFYESSRRKFLYAPTYHDVTQPVYRRAVGRWERYAAFLEPIQAKLAPYCRALGYAA